MSKSDKLNKDASTCYQEGKVAHQKDFHWKENPYPLFSEFHRCWKLGWFDNQELIFGSKRDQDDKTI